eukprot:scaffold4929_cov112-Isochrysis_galbana.AAC.1
MKRSLRIWTPMKRSLRIWTPMKRSLRIWTPMKRSLRIWNRRVCERGAGRLNSGGRLGTPGEGDKGRQPDQQCDDRGGGPRGGGQCGVEGGEVGRGGQQPVHQPCPAAVTDQKGGCEGGGGGGEHHEECTEGDTEDGAGAQDGQEGGGDGNHLRVG